MVTSQNGGSFLSNFVNQPWIIKYVYSLTKMVTSKNGDSFPSNFFNQPWIIKSHGEEEDSITFIDPMAANIEEKKIYIDDIKRKLCFGCIDEWLFLWDKKSRELFFLELNSLSKVHLPPLPREYRLSNIHTNFYFSSSPNHSDCTVIFTGATLEHETKPFLMCCQLHDKEWTKLLLHEDLDLIILKTCVIFDGKLYAYSVGHVTVFDIPSLLKGRIDSRTIGRPTFALYPRTDLVSTHFIKSCGHIYLVRMYSYLMGPIINMDISRLDTSSDKWLMVESIGERAFFLSHKSNNATSVCAIDVGVSCNCIYYVPKYYQADKMIYKFCLDDHTMTFSLILTEEMKFDNIFYWFVPRRPQKMITKSSESLAIVLNEYRDYDVLMEEKITSNICRPWDDLPMDLFELLVPHVSLVDSVRLFAVCKQWNLSSDSLPMAKTWPWLMYHEILDGTYKLLDPLNGKEYTTKIRLPSSAFPTQMLCSKHGWVVVLGHDHAMFMINPMIQHVIKLPSQKITDEDLCIIFTSISTSLDYIVMGICPDRSDDAFIEIHVWHIGEEKWTVIYNDEIPFCIANTNPVFLHGQLYCLGDGGELGIFNLVEKTWAMLDEPELVNHGDDNYFCGTEDCFLLELCGDLVSVFEYDCFDDESYLNDKTIVFKLDRVKMKWIEVEDLTGWTLFLDPRSSFAKPSPHKSWSNKIFFTSIYLGTTKTCASYCMENKRYEMNFCDTAKPLDCVWIEPNLAKKCLMNEP